MKRTSKTEVWVESAVQAGDRRAAERARAGAALDPDRTVVVQVLQLSYFVLYWELYRISTGSGGRWRGG